MNVEELRAFCLSLKGVEEGFPFDESTLVFKVMGKMFCLCGLENNPVQFNVKCDPEKAIELREEYSGVLPGYHMNKTHWNTLVFDGSFDDEQARGWINDSYALVAASLPKKLKEELAELS
ncbi:MAG: MmcQ/YjbR family DNA-binding protein [Flavobacteriales bacterium]|nr:MmcQ/YjbR family DNA-binding protein [Flavobacteriales bacterium]MCB9204170.1 MmcQ/YjbR family DNA-binding protein [Flavobacteriales bacterium]